MPTAVVLGGGVSGLAAAYYLQRLQTKFTKIILLEGQSRLGGWVDTTKTSDGAKFEHGPRSFRPAGLSGVNTVDLVDDLGLSNEVLPIPRQHPSTKFRYIFMNGKCHALPSSFTSMLKTVPPFSRPWAASMMFEILKPKMKDADESIHSFVKRRLGSEMAEYLVDPMCRGIFAGNSRELSVRSCLPPLYSFEQDDGSIVKGALWPSKGRTNPERRTALSQRAKIEGWAAWSLKEGAAQLTDNLGIQAAGDKRVDIRLQSPCTSITIHDGKLHVKTEDDTINADHVFSSIYSADLSKLLPNELTDLKQTLDSIPSVTVAVVNLEYPGDVLPVKGFGHLLPSTENKALLGMVYDSCTFPEHNRPGEPTTRITCMMGGAWFNDLLSAGQGHLTDEFLATMATEAAETQLGISVKPIRNLVKIQQNCIPQYLVGHWQKLKSIEQFSTKLPISYIGASYKGPSVNDCIYNAKLEVEKLSQS